MKPTFRKITCIALCLALLFSVSVTGFASVAGQAVSSVFEEDAYADIVTFSDSQNFGPIAYNKFAEVLTVMRDDGMPQPDSLLVGGDFTRVLPDYATPGIIQLRENYKNVYDGGDPDSVICIQGNHDLRVPGFYPTGMYDMGKYCLYLINEDQFPWKQSARKNAEQTVTGTAQGLKAALDGMIIADDMRPVIVMTHVPLHFTTRNDYGDNAYASYVFDVLNKAAEKLDIIFLFGHNHSGAYDDYIGGSVNFLAPGDVIRIPTAENRGENGYTEETLRFTYTNCGYIGYTKNNVTETSTNVLTLGDIRFFRDSLVILKYTEEGVFRVDEVERINPASDSDMEREVPNISSRLNNTKAWKVERLIIEPIVRFFIRLFNKWFK